MCIRSFGIGICTALVCIYGEYWLRLKSNHKNTYLRLRIPKLQLLSHIWRIPNNPKNTLSSDVWRFFGRDVIFLHSSGHDGVAASEIKKNFESKQIPAKNHQFP